MLIAKQQSDNRIFLAVALGAFLSFAFLCMATYYIQKNNIDAELDSRSQRFTKALQHEVNDEANRMRLLSSTYLLERPEIKKALREKDPDRLLQYSSDIFEQLKHNFGITHLYYHDTQRVNILRVHQPARHGDTISRITMLNAVKKGSSSSGYELGPLGTLTLRVVTPWYDGIGLLGYIELGKELELIVQNIANHEDMKILMAVDKSFLNHQGYELSNQKKHLPSFWNEFKSMVIINSKEQTPAVIHHAIEAFDRANTPSSSVIDDGQVYYSLSSVPIIDAANRKVGDYYILMDISAEVRSSRDVLITIALIGLLMTIGFLVFFKSKLNQSRKASNMLLQSIHCTGEAMLITDQDGVVEYVNPAYTKLTGYNSDELTGKLLASSGDDHSFYQAMWHSIRHSEVWNGKITNIRKDGSTYPANLTISPIYQDLKNHNVISHFIGIQSDLSEIESLEQQFHQAQKMEAIGTLVGGIAHDFNNMLAGISGNLHLAQQGTLDNPEVSSRLNNIKTLTFRAGTMIQQLLTFARKGHVSVKPIPLRAFIHDTLQLLQAAMPENITLDQAVCADEVMISGDETQLHQVLMNLLGNARDAVESVPQPRVRIGMELLDVDDTRLKKFPETSNRPFVHISVQDNGCGIPADKLEHLFEPFYTTKEQGKGTGLGLAMVFGAVQTHEGVIDVESIEGEGSTFHIYLPVLESLNGNERDESLSFVKGSGEVVLLVDDETHIIETGQVVLESLGYQVVTAMDGDQAVNIYKANADKIDICVLDVVMPVMGGNEAAREIRQVRPDAKIIFATGYDKNLLTDMDHETVVSKPFTVDELSLLIQSTLKNVV